MWYFFSYILSILRKNRLMVLNMKNKKILLSSLFSFSLVIPTLVSSCSSFNNIQSEIDNKEFKNQDEDDNLDNKNNNNLSKDEIFKNPSSNGDNNEIKNTDFHQYSLLSLQNKTPYEILLNSNTYKIAVSKMINYLKEDNKWNSEYFKYPNNKEEYLKNLLNIGIYGDFGDSSNQKINANPYLVFTKETFNRTTLKQKYLENFDYWNLVTSSIKINNKIDDNLIEKIIKNNPYGFLPSNISQYLYLLNYDEISNIFGISNIENIKANYNDVVGTLEILLIDSNNNKYIIDLNKDNTNNLMKNDNDYYQYIYDRSLMITTPLYEYGKKTAFSSKDYKIYKKNNQGTLWVFDRIKTDDQNNYTFLVGTNMHVLSYVNSFDRNSLNRFPSDDLKKYWNGGFQKEGDVINEVTGTNKGKYATLTRSSFKKQANIKLGKWNKEHVKDIVTGDAGNNQKVQYYENSSINSNNYLDRIWYTPHFNTFGVEANNNSYNSNWLTQTKNGWETTNAGTDFVITKLSIPKDDLKYFFPTLEKLINTDREKEWYLKLPDTKNNLYISPNQTFYTAGYPGNAWNGIKSTGGLIQTQNRNIDSNDNVSYWTRYNDEVNKTQNTNHDKWKYYEKSFENDYNKLEHGMSLSFTIQNSILSLYNSQNKYQPAGASGSLTIDSRFNSIGILFSGLMNQGSIDSTNESNFITNQISLFNSQGSYKNWNGNIKEDIIKKLRTENIKTISLNS